MQKEKPWPSHKTSSLTEQRTFGDHAGSQVPTIQKIQKIAETHRYSSCTRLLTHPLLRSSRREMQNRSQQCSSDTLLRERDTSPFLTASTGPLHFQVPRGIHGKGNPDILLALCLQFAQLDRMRAAGRWIRRAQENTHCVQFISIQHVERMKAVRSDEAAWDSGSDEIAPSTGDMNKSMKEMVIIVWLPLFRLFFASCPIKLTLCIHTQQVSDSSLLLKDFQ